MIEARYKLPKNIFPYSYRITSRHVIAHGLRNKRSMQA